MDSATVATHSSLQPASLPDTFSTFVHTMPLTMPCSHECIFINATQLLHPTTSQPHFVLPSHTSHQRHWDFFHLMYPHAVFVLPETTRSCVQMLTLMSFAYLAAGALMKCFATCTCKQLLSCMISLRKCSREELLL